MFGAQRLQIIREIILEDEFVDVQKLSEQLQVSEVTIRRDLEKLEKEGLVVKKYGGAVLNKDYVNLKNPVSSEEKDEDQHEVNDELIGRMAADMVEGDEAVFLGAGNISRKIAKNLGDNKKLVVITNDIYVAQILDSNSSVKVIVTGGNMISNSGILIGPFTTKMIDGVFVNKAFVELKGAHLKSGYTMESHEEIEIIKSIHSVSNEIIGMVNHKRFGISSLFKLGDLSIFSKVISNKEIPEEYKKYYYDNGIKLFITYDLK